MTDPQELGDLGPVLLEELKSAAAAYAAGDLAYLTATSKVEGPLRDALAARLNNRLDGRLVVAREWHRADIALLTPAGHPRALIEATAFYTFDAVSDAQLSRYGQKVLADLAKAAATGPGASCYALLLCTHLDGEVPPALRDRVIKYASGVAGALRRFGNDPDRVRAEARQRVEAFLDRIDAPRGHAALQTGTVFGITVALDAWVVGPVAPAQAVVATAGDRGEAPVSAGAADATAAASVRALYVPADGSPRDRFFAALQRELDRRDPLVGFMPRAGANYGDARRPAGTPAFVRWSLNLPRDRPPRVELYLGTDQQRGAWAPLNRLEGRATRLRTAFGRPETLNFERWTTSRGAAAQRMAVYAPTEVEAAVPAAVQAPGLPAERLVRDWFADRFLALRAAVAEVVPDLPDA